MIFILLLIFITFSCEKDSKIKEVNPVPVPIPVILPEGKSVFIDSLLLQPLNSDVLKEFYLASGFKSVWQSKNNRTNILEQISNSENEGLSPENYNVNKLQKFEKNYAALNENEKANYDILLTHSLQKYILHLTNGQINPRNLYQNWDLKRNEIDVNETLAQFLKSDALAYKIESLKPNHVVYESLKKALKIINSFPKDDFTAITITNKIVLNDTNPSLIDIKKRLIYWKDMKAKDSISDIYDIETNEAMRNFQTRHGLAADGVIGKGTIETLNFSKRQRKEQIIANLERWKWFPREMGKEYIIINIPDYKLSLVKDNDTIRTHKVIIGRPKRKTPVLSSKLTQVVFNPTWTVPPTILRRLQFSW